MADIDQPFPLRRRWNATIRLGVGAYDDYVRAAKQPGEAPDSMRMPNELDDGTGATHIKESEPRPEDGGQAVNTPLWELPDRVQQHEFVEDLKKGKPPFGVAMDAYLLAPEGQDPEMKERLAQYENLFRKAGIPARHLRFLPDLWASERLPWEHTRHGWYGQVSNQAYQEIVRQRHFDNFGSQWYVPTEARRHRTDFEVALASQLAPSPEEAAVFGMQDHYGLSEHEQEVGERKKFRTPDEEVGFSERKFGPPGLAEPLLVSNSLGNHRYHSYNGTWQRGRMHGKGVYRFADDTEYLGRWHEGFREGHGETTYKDGSSYVGEWKNGHFHGYGELKYSNGVVYKGMWVKGLRQGQGEMTWSRSGQIFKGEFYAGLRHGYGVCISPITGITFEGEFRKGQVHGAGTLIFTDHKTKKQRRVRRGLWHKSEFAPAGFLKMKDLVHIIDKEDSKATREKATDYLKIHGTVLAAGLNEWCYNEKKRLRDARREKKEEEEEEKRQAQIERKQQVAELRRQAKEAKEKAANDSDFENDSDDDEAAAAAAATGSGD